MSRTSGKLSRMNTLNLGSAQCLKTAIRPRINAEVRAALIRARSLRFEGPLGSGWTWCYAPETRSSPRGTRKLHRRRGRYARPVTWLPSRSGGIGEQVENRAAVRHRPHSPNISQDFAPKHSQEGIGADFLLVARVIPQFDSPDDRLRWAYQILGRRELEPDEYVICGRRQVARAAENTVAAPQKADLFRRRLDGWALRAVSPTQSVA